MTLSIRTLTVAVLGLGSAVAFQPAPAEAQVYYGQPINQGGYIRYLPGAPVGAGAGFNRPVVQPRGFGPGVGRVPYYRPVAGGYRGPVYGPRWRSGYYGHGYYGRGYYPYRRYYGGYYPYGYYRRGYYDGGAVAAGLFGGLALGAIASAVNQPYYYPGYRQAYYPAYNRCFFERRRVVARNGRVVVRRVRTCY